MREIAILDGNTLNPGDLAWDCIRAFGKVRLYSRTSLEQLHNHIGEAEIVLVNKVRLGADILARAPRLRCICVTATGYNNIDLEEAARRGIVVLNARGYGTHSVAQHVFAMVLHLTNQVALHHASVIRGDWGEQPDFCYWHTPLQCLEGKVMGILGFGAIGQAVGHLAIAFGMQVLVCTRKSRDLPLGVKQASDFGELLACSDVLSLHVPLTVATRGIMNRETLQLMKKGSILVNTARGELVDEQDLAKALASGRPAYAALDVLGQEPPKSGSPLFEVPNCVLTPHIAWATWQARERLLQMTVSNIQDFLLGKWENNLAQAVREDP